MLDGVEGEAAETLKKLLDKPIPSSKDLEKAIESYEAVRESLPEDDRKKLEKAIGFQMMGRTMADKFQESMDKFLEFLKKPSKVGSEG